jgi:UDP-N-acetylmuramoyl-tripeptide--D-alanyl-D-alanine ligase
MPMTRISAFDTPFLVDATGGTAVGEPRGDRVITDSRLPLVDALFVALPGERFDGHDFVAPALAAGAGGAVVSRSWFAAEGSGAAPVLVVPDTLGALHDLARAHRRRFPVPLVAITGSNGKTTTKELLALALTPLGPVLKTSGNRNNHIGLPLTLLELGPEHRAASVEIGLNHPGELRELAALAGPRVAVITSVAESHLEGLGTVDGVARAKSEIAEALPPDGTLIVPEGVAPLERALTGYRGRRRTFGLEPTADVHPRAWSLLGRNGIRLEMPDGTAVQVPLLGEHAARNALAALAAAEAMGVPARDAAPRLAAVRPTPGRLAPLEVSGVVVLDDTYNANPASVGAALAVLRSLEPARRRWAVLGDMLELGPEGPALHRRLGEAAAFVDGLVTVGELAADVGRGAVAAGLAASRHETARDGEEAARRLLPRLESGDVVLVKGSRGMHLETAVTALREGLEGKG